MQTTTACARLKSKTQSKHLRAAQSVLSGHQPTWRLSNQDRGASDEDVILHLHHLSSRSHRRLRTEDGVPGSAKAGLFIHGVDILSRRNLKLFLIINYRANILLSVSPDWTQKPRSDLICVLMTISGCRERQVLHVCVLVQRSQRPRRPSVRQQAD